MHRFVQKPLLIIIGLLGFIGNGCESNPSNYSGEYEGQITISSINGIKKNPVKLLAKLIQNDTLAIFSESDSNHLAWEFRKIPAIDEIHLQTWTGIPFQGMLLKSPFLPCYESSALHPKVKVKLCLTDTGGNFEISNSTEKIEINASKSFPNDSHGDSQDDTLNLEKPSQYNSDELRERSKEKSFESRAMFEGVTRAKLNTRLHYLNLIPHLSNGSAVALATLSGVPGLLASMGDLVPFLLPTRWIQAEESIHLLNAQRYATQIMQLDAMQITEGLCMLVLRDKELGAQLKTDRALINEFEQKIDILEKAGHAPPGSVLALETIGNEIDQVLNNLDAQIGTELTNLAQAVGFNNPNAILALTPGSLADISSPTLFDLSFLEKITMSKSLEVRQIDTLIESAKLDKVNRSFQWLDPSGDPDGGVGIALPTYVEIGSSHQRDLIIAKEFLKSTLLRKITDAYNDYAGWKDSLKLNQDGLELQQKRIELAKQGLESSNSGFAISQLKDALSQLSINHTNQITAKYSWYISLSRINRMTLSGPYQ